MGATGGAMVTAGVYKGKYYWEFLVSGRCAVVGVGNKDYDTSNEPGYNDRSWGYGDIGGVDVTGTLVTGGFLLHGGGVRVGPAIQKETVIGMAMNVGTGQLWIAQNGQWLGTGADPVTGKNPLVTLTELFDEMHPVAGSGCESQSESVTIKGRFRAENMTYAIPEGYLPLEASDCACSKDYLQCMESGNCATMEVRSGILEDCVSSGCAPAECGITARITSEEQCQSKVPIECNDEFLRCAGDGNASVCTCTRRMFECMADNGCQLDSNKMQEFAVLCAYNKCSMHECGMCSATCNVTQLACTKAYMMCEERASRKDLESLIDPTNVLSPYHSGRSLLANVTGQLETYAGHCECASQFYQCTASGGCVTDDISRQHAELCTLHNCTAAQCGVPKAFQQCNKTNMECTRRYLDCAGNRPDPAQDICVQNFAGKAGIDFCTNPKFGGITSCQYDENSDECYTSGDCACSKAYFECMGEACIDSKDVADFAQTCLVKGCTAAQCGIGYFACNQTSLMCANEYLDCELTDFGESDNEVSSGMSTDMVEAPPTKQPWCSTSMCLRNYFQCMRDANCTSTQDLQAHLEICAEAGCTPGQCGVSPQNEVIRAPDAPQNVLLTSVLGARITVSWVPSNLARLWARQGSKNVVLQYNVALFGNCIIDQGNLEYKCGTHIRNVTIFSNTPNRVTFGGDGTLVIGQLYRAEVYAINVNGTGPIAWGGTRLSGPPSEPTNVVALRTGQIAASVNWQLPLDTGDTTRTRPLLSYTVEVKATPDSMPIAVEVPNYVTSYAVQTSIGGTWTDCATEGQVCLCYGNVRFGIGTLWSEPYFATGSVVCDVGPIFPELLKGRTMTCQCSSDAQVLKRGQNFSARVLATNSVGKGNYSQPASVKVMGAPGVISNISAQEVPPEAPNTMLVTWVPPADTGFGQSDPSAPILSYTVIMSLCITFDYSNTECKVSETTVDPRSCTRGNCSLNIPEAGNLIEGNVYYIKVPQACMLHFTHTYAQCDQS